MIPVKQAYSRYHLRNRRVMALIQLAAILLAMLMIRENHPNEIRVLPPCPSQYFLRLHCAGCGSTRATHFILNAQFGDAWRHNPLLIVLGIPAALIYIANLGFVIATGRGWRLRQIPAFAAWSLLVIIVAYTIVRNVPLDSLGWLRPP